MLSRLKPAAPLTQTPRWTLIALIACSAMTSSCAIFGRASVATAPTAEAPKLVLPAETRKACELYRLPSGATQSDLEVGYATRGAQIVSCDAARALAVVTFDRQALAAERQEEARERRRSRACRWIGLGCG